VVWLNEFLVLLHACWKLQVIEVNQVQQKREIMGKILSCSTLLHVSCLHVHSYSLVSAVLQSFPVFLQKGWIIMPSQGSKKGHALSEYIIAVSYIRWCCRMTVFSFNFSSFSNL
jgi:hypothetical protein